MIPVFGRSYSAFLFDMDGTILTSIASAERVWGDWAARHGLDVAAFLPTFHGVRTIDTIRNLNLPNVDPLVEAEAIMRAEIADVSDIVPIDGAADFLRALPADRWAIVTSATRPLAEARLAAAGLPLPAMLICGEDIDVGKPAPDGYLEAASRLGVAPEACLVFEDAPAGIAAGEAAGAGVIVITQAHAKPFATDHQTIRNYRDIALATHAGGLVIAPAA